uniref:Transposase (Putative), gypsy type n=1 Tax=Tanacetum cinerariifolium TaxID=118510 RepID=A0A6L2KWZ3_TANCI|nr:transposase (putative), gypsy type [Tanacetum cinerariifolium]
MANVLENTHKKEVEIENGVRSSDDGLENVSKKDDVEESKARRDYGKVERPPTLEEKGLQKVKLSPYFPLQKNFQASFVAVGDLVLSKEPNKKQNTRRKVDIESLEYKHKYDISMLLEGRIYHLEDPEKRKAKEQIFFSVVALTKPEHLQEVLAIERIKQTFWFHFNTSSKTEAIDFTLDGVLDEATKADETIKPTKDVTATPPSLESAKLEDEGNTMLQPTPNLQRGKGNEFCMKLIFCDKDMMKQDKRNLDWVFIGQACTSDLLTFVTKSVPMSSDTKKVGQNNMSPQWQKSDVPVVVSYMFLRRNAMRNRIQGACDHQKSYFDVSRKPLELQVGDKVKLKSLSWKEFICFGKRGKLNPRDTIQLETAVTTISHEYLLEFTSEYGISEALHSELSGLEDRIVVFLEGKIVVYTKFFKFAKFRLLLSQFLFDILGYYQIHLSQLSVIGVAKVSHFEINCRVFYIVPTLNERVFSTIVDWRTSTPKDGMLAENTYSPEAVMILNTHRTPIQKQPKVLLLLCRVEPQILSVRRDMDLFSLIRDPNPTKVKTVIRPRAAHEVPLLTVTASRVIQMEDPAADLSRNMTTTGVAPEVGQSEGITATGPHLVKERRKRGNDGVDTNAPPKVLRRDHVDPRPTESTCGRKSLAAIELGMRFTHPVPTSQGAPMDVNDPDLLSFTDPQSRPSADVTQSSNGAATARDPKSKNTSFTSMVASPESFIDQNWAGENKIKNLETLLEAESDMKKATEGRSIKLSKELENMWALFLDLQVSNNHLSQQVSTIQVQVMGEENLKAAFEEFKQYKDNQVKQRCVKIDARLDALSIDFDEELYLHMLIVITGRMWEIGHGLRLAVMKCGESTKLRQAFVDIVLVAITKGMSEGRKNGVKHGKTNLSLEAIEAYNPEDEAKYITALHALKDLKYPILDQLGSLKDTPMDVIMAFLHLKSDTRDDAPQPLGLHEEILLANAITANVSRAKKKKKCRVVRRTHGVGFLYHARSNGVLVSMPTVAPQGLAILLADGVRQTEISKDAASPRLLRSSSLPVIHN